MNYISDIGSDLQKIDEIILEFSRGKSPLIEEISHHLIKSGGKRLRPILLILSAKLCAAQNYNNLAAAVELIHAATLLHDDVVDSSEIRRGKKTANAIWDNKISILVGDYLFSVAFQLMVKSENLEVLDLLSKTSSIMADGEVLQLQHSSDINLKEEKYFEIIFCKTAALFSCACKSAALVSDATKEQIEALSEFGKNFGITFQIIDDIIDYSSSEKAIGKDLGNDFFEGKVTLPILITYSQADEADKKIIADIFTKNLNSSEKDFADFEKILSLMKKYKAIELTVAKAKHYSLLAQKNLESFENSSAKLDLTALLTKAFEKL